MKRLQQTALFIVMTFSLLFAAQGTVGAINLLGHVCNNPNAQSTPTVCQDNATGAKNDPLFGSSGIIGITISILSLVVAIIAVFVIIISGVKMIVSSGDANQIASAKRTIIYAVVSLLIVAGVQLGIRLLINRI